MSRLGSSAAPPEAKGGKKYSQASTAGHASCACPFLKFLPSISTPILPPSYPPLPLSSPTLYSLPFLSLSSCTLLRHFYPPFSPSSTLHPLLFLSLSSCPLPSHFLPPPLPVLPFPLSSLPFLTLSSCTLPSPSILYPSYPPFPPALSHPSTSPFPSTIILYPPFLLYPSLPFLHSLHSSMESMLLYHLPLFFPFPVIPFLPSFYSSVLPFFLPLPGDIDDLCFITKEDTLLHTLNRLGAVQLLSTIRNQSPEFSLCQD